MTPRIVTLTEKKLVGKQLRMSLKDNRTGELWKSLMQRRSEIKNNVGTDLISLQVYPNDYFDAFQPEKQLVKWATVEVTDFNDVPAEMGTFLLKGGLYAVFDYKGGDASAIFGYIFGEWLPSSEYRLDDRPHFEVLGEKYKNGDPNSEEEIWIPIKK